MRMRKGYTLIEIIVAISIIMLVLTLVMANSRRGGNDSVLARETNLLMSRLRYAQELTASGSILRYQGGAYSGASCLTNNQCNFKCTLSKNVADSCGTYDGPDDGTEPDLINPVTSCQCCPVSGVAPGNCENGKETPQGGFAVGFSCRSDYGGVQAQLGSESYYLVADRIKCVGKRLDENGNQMYDNGNPIIGSCWPPVDTAWNYNAFNEDSDGIISLYYWGAKGDTVKEKYTVDTTIEIKDLRVTYTSVFQAGSMPAARNSFTCTDSSGNPTKSPWGGLYVPGVPDNGATNWYYKSIVSDSFPIQATVRFMPPDGRIIDVNDNIYSYAPKAVGGADMENPVKSVEIMLKLKNRSTDCRVVTVTRAGLISQRVDADCDFAT
ncbi:MAG: prepilin-type N-terminal cleavage/methylation domain-containing protein [Patescibacteria group bacterium]